MLRRAPLLLLALAASAHAASQTNSPAPPKLRLGDAALPTRYSARVRIVPEEERFSASIDIALVLRAPSALVWLNGTGLTVDAARFDVGTRQVAARVVPGGEDYLGFATNEPLPAGPVKLHVEYHGQMESRASQGLFREKEDGRWYAVTQFEATDARRLFPCYDEPSSKVPWQLTLEVPADEVALSNTAATGERRDGKMKIVSFAETRPLPSYLVAVAVGPFELVDAGRAGQKKVPLRIVVPAGRAAHARYTAKTAGEIINRLEGYFGIPYPYDKLDLVAVPLFSGAMENAGLVTFGQQFLVAKPEDESLRFEREFLDIGLHELAHQWFGDLVTSAFWDDIWLNEAFASWMTTHILDEWKPEWDHGARLIDERAAALKADALMSARQIRQPIVTRDDIFNVFDRITYAKGETVIGMFESWIGRDKFQRGIRRYLNEHAWKTAVAADFLAAISAEAGRDIAPAFNTFLEQAGAPLVSLELSCGGGKPALALAQERFMPVGARGATAQHWQVPVCVRYDNGGGDSRACTLLDGASGRLALDEAKGCPRWVLGNDGERGYYRVAYGKGLLTKLLGDGAKHLTLPELAGLIGDAGALAQAGKLPLGPLLADLVPHAADGRLAVVEALTTLVGALRDRLVADGQRANFARLAQKLYGQRARALGWTPRPGDDEDTRLLRATLVGWLADYGEDQPLRSEATVLARRWLGDRKAVDGDLVAAVLKSAALGGDRALFDAMHAEAKRADRLDRQRLLSALGQFRDPALVRAALDLMLSGELDVRETLRVLSDRRGDGGIFSSSATRALGYPFVKQHFAELLERLTKQSGTFLMRPLGSFCDERARADVEAFLTPWAPQLPGGPRALAQTLETIDQCSRYAAVQQSSLASFLKKQ